MKIIQIIAGALSLFSPSEEQIQNARKKITINIQEEYYNKNCHKPELVTILSDTFRCCMLDFMLDRKDDYIKHGRFYHPSEQSSYTIETKKRNYKDDDQPGPYDSCTHTLTLAANDPKDPLKVHQTWSAQCLDPKTNTMEQLDLKNFKPGHLK